MADPFKKVAPGEAVTFSAEQWNLFVDAAKAEQQRQLDRFSGTPSYHHDAAIVRVRNDSGEDLHRNSVLGLEAPIFVPVDEASTNAFLREVTFRGITPTAGHRGKFAVLLDPAANGRIARAYVAGVCQVRVDVQSPKHKCADVAVGDPTRLRSTKRGSAQLLWLGDSEAYDAYSDDERWAIIRFGSTCSSSGGGDAKERCDCPDDTYEVDVVCGDCTKLPKTWILTIVESRTAAYMDDCDDYKCIYLTPGTEIKLDNDDDPYTYGATCSWLGQGDRCVYAELTINDDQAELKIYTKDGCLLADLYLPNAQFDCCGVNAGWLPVPYTDAHCDVDVILEPDPCTCCPEEQQADDCGCKQPYDGPDLGKAKAMKFTVSGAVDGMPANCSVINNQGASDYYLPHAAPGSCAWFGGKRNLEDGEVGATAEIVYNPSHDSFDLSISATAIHCLWRCKADDFDCCHGGTFALVDEVGPGKLCMDLPASITVTGETPCCD